LHEVDLLHDIVVTDKEIAMKLITSLQQLIENIRRYATGAEELSELMAYSRAWYALRSKDGWLLAPSKFIGYEGMDAKTYRRERSSQLDGRATEKVLEQWSSLIEEGHPQYDELHAALAALFAHHGKTPNTLARISIVHSDGAPAHVAPPDELVNLLAAVYRRLPAAKQSEFRRIAMSDSQTRVRTCDGSFSGQN
jgi:hypothetical protein